MAVSLKHRLEYAALRTLSAYVNGLSETSAGRHGAALGRWVSGVWGQRRHIATENLKAAFPEMSEEKIADTVEAVFANFGRTMFETLRLPRLSPSDVLARVESDTCAQIDDALRAGRGALLVSAHIGNWEILGAYVRALGYPVDVVVKPMRNPLSDALLNSCRAAHDVGIIHTQRATAGIIRSLKQNRCVAILADQYAGQEGVEVEFFGRMVSTPRGPAALALKYGCPIFTGCCRRLPDGRFRAYHGDMIPVVRSGDDDVDVVALTQEFTRRIEGYIREEPEQWLWTHRRWGGRR